MHVKTHKEVMELNRFPDSIYYGKWEIWKCMCTIQEGKGAQPVMRSADTFNIFTRWNDVECKTMQFVIWNWMAARRKYASTGKINKITLRNIFMENVNKAI